jgi:monovalent cation:H+ antiporter-2, CPA2 family
MVWIGYEVGRAFGWNTMDSLFLGAMLLSSSTVIIVKALNDLRMSHEKFARFAFGILVLDDMAAIMAIAVLSGIAMSGQMSPQELVVTGGRIAIFLTVVLVAGLLILPGVLRFVAGLRNDETLLIVVLGLGFGMAVLAVRLGFSTALGAFLVGAIIAETREGRRVRPLVEPVRDMFSAVFFVSIGLMLDPRLVVEYWPAVLAVTATLVIGKTLTGAIGSMVAGNDLRTSLRVGMGLAQIGEFAFIIAALGSELGVTSAFLYPIAVSVSGLTTISTPMLIRHSDAIAARIEAWMPLRLREYMNFYTQWLARWSESQRKTGQVRAILRRIILQIVFNVLLIAGIIIAISAAPQWVRSRLEFVPADLGGPEAVLFLAALLACLPILVAVLRKLRAMAMLMAEVTIPVTPHTPQRTPVRQLVAQTIFGLGLSAIALFIFTVSASILPSWPVVLTLIVVVGGIAGALWAHFTRVYARAQVALRDVFETPASAGYDSDALSTLVARAEIATVRIEDLSPAAGRLIRDLDLRGRSGVTIVGIERGSQSIVSPGPEEELHPGDLVLLIGSSEQIEAARTLLAPPL